MTKQEDYKEKFYRKWVADSGLLNHEIVMKETEILVSAEKDIKELAEKVIRKYRKDIEDYISGHPGFKSALEPVAPDTRAPRIIKEMTLASTAAGVGPMAAVAGAISELAGKELLSHSRQIIVENGGDIFIKSDTRRSIGIFAGADSPLTNKLIIKINPEDTPLGICTSSGTVGHSLSFGKADACVIISKSTPLADAVATAACNRVKDAGDIASALDFALSIDGVRGALIALGKEFGVKGNIELA